MNLRLSLIVLLFIVPRGFSVADEGNKADKVISGTQVLVAAPGSIEVDGAVDELWQLAPSIRLKRSVAVLTRTEPSAWPESTFRCLWDDKNLYILAEIDDGTPGNENSTPWEQDSIEVFLDENLGRTKTYEADDAQVRIARSGQVTGTEFRDKNVVKSSVIRHDHSYLVEMAIQWRTIKPHSGMRIGIDFQVSDDPSLGRRMAILKWNDPSDESWRDTSRYGTLVLGSLEQAAKEIDDRKRLESSDSLDTRAKDTQQPATSQNSKGGTAPSDHSATTKSSLAVSDGTMQHPSNQILGTTTVTTSFSSDERVPDWVADAVFYQIFPERFRNGDPSNDPDRQSLEFPDIIPSNWKITPWTQQWYVRCPWESDMGPDFYENGVFHRRYGGDLKGVLDKLDYLANLGINTIYFNPLFYARSLHKYDGSSFHHIDPHFGPDPAGDFELMRHESADPATWKWTAADRLFLEVIQVAREYGIRIILDGVFNHTGRDFFAFSDIVRNQQKSTYLDWYNIRSFDDPATEGSEFKYDCWWGVDTLPELAANSDGTDLSSGPKNYIMNSTKRWMDPNADGVPDDGIAGWRLDVANEVPNNFWQDWHRLVRSINPDAFTVAEIWDESSAYLAECQFSSTMNYHGFAFPLKGFLVDNKLPASHFVEMYTSRNQLHSNAVQFGLLNLMDSHDTDRIASMIVGSRKSLPYQRSDRFDYDVGDVASPRHNRDYDVSRPTAADREIQKLVALFQFCVPGPPMVYYGTEVGMDGADDPDDRMPMVWADLKYEPRTVGPSGHSLPVQPQDFDHQLHEFYRDLIRLRRDSNALRRGELTFLWADDSQQSLLFSRKFGSELVLVAVNRSSKEASIELPMDATQFPSSGQLELVFSTSDEPWKQTIRFEDQQLRGIIPSQTGCVWRLSRLRTAVRNVVD